MSSKGEERGANGDPRTQRKGLATVESLHFKVKGRVFEKGLHTHTHVIFGHHKVKVPEN